MTEVCPKIFLAIPLCIFGCSAGAPVSPSTPVTPAPITTGVKAKFAYTGNEGGSLSGYSVDASTGALSGLSGFPLKIGSNPIVVTHDPQNRFLIVGDIASSQVFAFSINSSTGALTQTTTAASVFEAIGAVVDPSGAHVYLVSQGANSVGALALGPTGVLTPISGQPFATGGTQDFGDAIVMDAAGTFLYVQDMSNVYVYSIVSGTGALSLVQTVTGTGYGGGLALDPSDTYLYVGEPTNHVVAAYSVSPGSGRLTYAKTAAAADASAVAISPTGQFAYVLVGYQELRMYTVSGGSFTMTGSLSGIFGQQVAVDPSGRFVYVPQACSQNCPGGVYNVVNEYAIGNSGVLTPIAGGSVATGVTPTQITFTTQ